MGNSYYCIDSELCRCQTEHNKANQLNLQGVFQSTLRDIIILPYSTHKKR